MITSRLVTISSLPGSIRSNSHVCHANEKTMYLLTNHTTYSPLSNAA